LPRAKTGKENKAAVLADGLACAKTGNEKSLCCCRAGQEDKGLKMQVKMCHSERRSSSQGQAPAAAYAARPRRRSAALAVSDKQLIGFSL